MPRVSHADMVDSVVSTGGTVVLLGGIDTGKTSFALSVAEAARARGMAVAFVDADIGQSTVGPPTCVGLKFCGGLERVDRETVADADALAFVGSITPQGHLLTMAAATARMVDAARDAGSALVVVDTSGYISGINAEQLKFHKVELIRPDLVIGFERGEELEPILGSVRRFFAVPVTALKVDAAVAERSAEERLAYREERLRAYFSPPLTRWRVRTTVFMPTIPPELDLARLDGLVVSLDDGKGNCMGLGALEYDHGESVLRMVTSVAEAAKGLRLGSVRITAEGHVAARVNLRELFGTV